MPPSPLTVRRRGDVVDILAGSVVLLSSAALETERAFGELAATLAGRPPERVLVGGLGFGETMRGVLAVVGAGAQVVVAEKVSEVVELVRGDVVPGASAGLDDPRVTLVVGDVGEVLRERGPFDAVLLDVDNGPGWASFRTNAALYTPAGLEAARDALTPGGALAVWSGYPADAFLARLRAAGLSPSRVLLREKGRVRARAYVGVRPGAAAHSC